jgi:hypothetical protein
MYNRGGLNLDYDKGFIIEAEKFEIYKPIILRLLTASNIELTSRTILDTECGIDAIAKINIQHYFIGLRFRKTNKDYNSITLSRHISDNVSEIKKFLYNKVKPDFFISITELKNEIRIVEVNIDSFKLYLKKLIKDNDLENFYNSNLMAYEFSLKDFEQSEHGIRNFLIKKNKVYT